MRRETGGATAGLTFQGSAVRSTTVQTTASMEAHAQVHPWVSPLQIQLQTTFFLYVLLLFLFYINKANEPIGLQHVSQNSSVHAAGVHANKGYFTILGFIKVVKKMILQKQRNTIKNKLCFLIYWKKTNLLPSAVWICHSWLLKGMLGNKNKSCFSCCNYAV